MELGDTHSPVQDYDLSDTHFMNVANVVKLDLNKGTKSTQMVMPYQRVLIDAKHCQWFNSHSHLAMIKHVWYQYN